MTLPEEYKMAHLAKQFGIRNILKTPDFIISSGIAVLICLLFFVPNNYGGVQNFENVVSPIVTSFLTMDAALIGLVLSAFAITVTYMDNDFGEILKKAKLWDDAVFLFVYDICLIIAGLIFSVFFIVTSSVKAEFLSLSWSIGFMDKTFFALSVFFSVYGLLSIVYLVYYMKDLALLKGEFIVEKLKKEESS